MSRSRVRAAARRATLMVAGERAYERLRARSVARDIRTGRWTEPEIALVPHAVARGDAVADVGANFGMWSFNLSNAVGPEGTVHAFEPIPATCSTLEGVLGALGARNVRVVAAGASDEAGSARFVVPRRSDGSADPANAWGVRDGLDAGGDAVDVPLVRLDDELEGPELSFLKCDVEGAELFALRGATRLLERDAPTLVLETSRPAMSRYDVAPEQLQQLLDGLGYSTFRYEQGSRSLVRGTAGDRDANLVAVHPRRAERLAALLPA